MACHVFLKAIPSVKLYLSQFYLKENVFGKFQAMFSEGLFFMDKIPSAMYFTI